MSYASFYNPLNLVRALPRFDKLWAQRILFQFYGMVGVTRSIYNRRGWIARLMSGPIERLPELPRTRFPVFSPQGVELDPTPDG